MLRSSILVCAALMAACGESGDVEVPAGDHCAPTADWTGGDFEAEVLDLVNQARAAGATCGGTAMPAVPALAAQPQLTCAARLHSLDMVDRSYFAHTNPDGEEPWDRMTEAGYAWSSAGENIASGQATPASVMNSWMNSPGHCQNIMSDSYVDIGIGYYAPMWTQVFGRP